jgi:hypothetical protein
MTFFESLKKFLTSPTCGCTRKQKGRRRGRKQRGGYRTEHNKTLKVRRSSSFKQKASSI